MRIWSSSRLPRVVSAFVRDAPFQTARARFSAPVLVSDTTGFTDRFRPVPGRPLTFTAPGLVQGKQAGTTTFVPFFRVHDARYVVYWPYSTPGDLESKRAKAAEDEAERLALDARTIDQVAPGEQQPESDHFFKADGAAAGINKGKRWRHASNWFSYDLTDKKGEARVLRLTYSTLDAGRRFDILVNDKLLAEVTLAATAPQELYTRDYPLPAGLGARLVVKFVARDGSIAGGLYGLRLLR